MKHTESSKKEKHGMVMLLPYITLDVKQEQWCKYKGKCKRHMAAHVQQASLCYMCKYRKPLDIAKMLDDKYDKIDHEAREKAAKEVLSWPQDDRVGFEI